MKLSRTVPIERTTLSAATFERLITNVVHGTWKAGQQIPTERILCQQLGIARNSLLEALERHREIYQAIRGRNVQASRALMQEHLNETTTLITQLTASMTGSLQSNEKNLRKVTESDKRRPLARTAAKKN